jgi:hypothetical protein
VAEIGHVAMVPAMVGAMLYRRRDYTSPSAAEVSAAT